VVHSWPHSLPRTDRNEHMDPNLPILQRLPDIFDMVLVCEVVPIFNKTTAYFHALLFSKEFCSLRVVVNLEVCPNGHDESDNALEDLGAVRYTKVEKSATRTNIQLQPCRPPWPLNSVTPLAINPPNAPAAVAAEKKIALQVQASKRPSGESHGIHPHAKTTFVPAVPRSNVKVDSREPVKGHRYT